MGKAKSKLLKLAPVHPGEVLREEFMVVHGLSMNKLSLALRVPVTRIAEIVHERRGITVDTALRLGVYFGTKAEFWLNLQRSYDLAMVEDVLLSQIKKEVLPLGSSGRGG